MFDDDFETFFDPDDFGERVELVVDGVTFRPCGLLLKEQGADTLGRPGSSSSKVRVVHAERLFQTPLAGLPVALEGGVVTCSAGVFSIVGPALPVSAGIVNLQLVPHVENDVPLATVVDHGRFLRD